MDFSNLLELGLDTMIEAVIAILILHYTFNALSGLIKTKSQRLAVGVIAAILMVTTLLK